MVCITGRVYIYLYKYQNCCLSLILIRQICKILVYHFVMKASEAQSLHNNECHPGLHAVPLITLRTGWFCMCRNGQVLNMESPHCLLTVNLSGRLSTC